MAVNQLGHNPQEIILNDITDDATTNDDDEDDDEQQSIFEE
eukprot:CAMPEP_0201574266 /NCGR_PEP_ID=MMETSP0190_2-20130828/18662_1 /ASSEMBLY_ACC=CAM_ASM_000263 /TAXON_ID=37353 /ORGANISM="Rosalina sp." /LENGTH=40 /DNA_ID= /DNA_START= /DNA_END= /DNA_ORIENTATION=